MATRGRFTGGRSKVGKRDDLNNVFFRSAWEANYARYLNYLVEKGEIVRWEYEPQKFEFPVKRGNRSYLPDFRVWVTDDEYAWHEVKGYMDDASRIKLRRFELHHPNESARLQLIDRAVYKEITKEFSEVIPGWE